MWGGREFLKQTKIYRNFLKFSRCIVFKHQIEYFRAMTKRILANLLLLAVCITFSSYDFPTGWYKSGKTPENYEMGIDRGAGQFGSNAGTIKSIEPKTNGWGNLMEEFSPEKFLGKKICMSAYMKTKEVTRRAAFWMRVDKKYTGPALSFDNMGNRPIRGTTDWTKYEIVLDVPVNTCDIAFGVFLIGGGQIWFDSFTFEIVGDAVSSKHATKVTPEFDNEPANLDFEN